DIHVVIAEMGRLRRLSERLLVIAGSDDPGFLHPEPAALDEFAIETVQRWCPTAPRRWQLGPLDPVTVRADLERLRPPLGAPLENAGRHTPQDRALQLSLIRGPGAHG